MTTKLYGIIVLAALAQTAHAQRHDTQDPQQQQGSGGSSENTGGDTSLTEAPPETPAAAPSQDAYSSAAADPAEDADCKAKLTPLFNEVCRNFRDDYRNRLNN